MYCKRCGYSLNENDTQCPFCGSKVSKEETNVAIIKKENTERTYDNNLKTYDDGMKEIRNHLGYVNLKTHFWHHLLIAGIGYFLISVLGMIVSPLLVSYFETNGFSFDCIRQNPNDFSKVCPVEVVNQYTLLKADVQVICELLVVAIVAIIFIKYFKTFFKELSDKQTWKTYAITLAIIYGLSFIYSTILQLVGYVSPPSNENQDAVNEIIYNFPLIGFAFVVLAAPLFEEIIFRFGVFRTFTHSSKKMEIVGIVITTILFAGVHMIATVETAQTAAGFDWELFWGDMVTLPIYLIGAFGLTFAYYKSKNLATSMLAHMTYNFMSFIAIIGSRGLEEQIEAIIHLLTRL